MSYCVMHITFRTCRFFRINFICDITVVTLVGFLEVLQEHPVFNINEVLPLLVAHTCLQLAIVIFLDGTTAMFKHLHCSIPNRSTGHSGDNTTDDFTCVSVCGSVMITAWVSVLALAIADHLPILLIYYVSCLFLGVYY